MSEIAATVPAEKTSRRDFLKQGATAVAAGAVANMSLQSAAYAAGSDTLRVALIGCGGRGTGAARNALAADPNTKLVAMADAFGDYLDRSLRGLQNSAVQDQLEVDDDHKFVGFDAYKHAIDACDVALLATPPHFRPEHLRYAVEKGKHVFCEKPVAVDAPGCRSVFETSRLAAEKGLSLVSGLCWRYDPGMREVFARLHNGEAGEIAALQCSYNSQGVWDPRVTREEVDSDMEYQMRNWYYYTWLSGDFNVEQHIHSIDKMLWAMRDEPPVKCSGSGGRIQRTDPKYGNIYDHFDVVYEFTGGIKAFARCRHFAGCATDVSDYAFCTKGQVQMLPKPKLTDLNGNPVWESGPVGRTMYQQEHDELFASIRSGSPINNGDYMTKSTLMAIMGRMCCYTGKELTWEQALNSKEDLSPPAYEWGPLKTRPVAIPGLTPFV